MNVETTSTAATCPTSKSSGWPTAAEDGECLVHEGRHYEGRHVIFWSLGHALGSCLNISGLQESVCIRQSECFSLSKWAMKAFPRGVRCSTQLVLFSTRMIL